MLVLLRSVRVIYLF